MTSRERFLKVLNGEVPDRVPVTLFIQDSGHFINQMYPDIDPWDFEALQLKVIECQKQLGVDVFVRVLFCTDDSYHFIIGGVDIDHQTESWQVKTTEVRKNESTLLKQSKITTPGGRSVCENRFGICRLLKPGKIIWQDKTIRST